MSKLYSSHFSDCAFRYLVLFVVVLELFPFRINYTFGQSGRTLRGIVVDSLDGAIWDASVSLHSATTVLQATSDGKGQFEFSNLPAGEYEIVVTRRGFRESTTKGIQISDKDPERLRIILQPGPVTSYTPAVPYPATKFADPVIREEQNIIVNGTPEVWRLEWKTTPKSSCGLDDTSMATSCPCTGFAYGESGQLDLVRSTDGREIDRLKLTPFFNNESPDKGAATLQRWELQKKDLDELGSNSFLAQVRTRPLARIMYFADYNHDGSSAEFFLQTGVEPCGKIVGIVIGVTPSHPWLHAFGTALHPDKALVMQKREWEALLKAPGPTEVLDWPCGDHGSDTETDLALSALNGSIKAVRREFECTESGNRGRLLHEEVL
jgi:Carboxypeptidase regulatory-like domain